MRGDTVKYALSAVFLATSVVLIWPRERLEMQTVAGPSIPGKYKHAPSACELADGDIFLVYYSGSAEYGNDTAIYGTRQDHETKVWSRPRIVADEIGKAEGNPVVWRAPDDVLWLLFPVRQGETWSTSTLALRTSSDNGQTWSDAPRPPAPVGVNTRARPIVLQSGQYLVPVDLNPSTDTEFVSSESSSFFLRYDPATKSWSETQRIRSRLGNLQPAVAQLSDGRLIAYCRRGGDYAGQEDGFLVRSESSDGGLSWSPGEETEFRNPNSAVDFVKLANGHLLLAYNDSSFNRSSLAIAISDDGDQSYPFRKTLVAKEGESYAYPTILQTRDGAIHLFFTLGIRSHIVHSTFLESDIPGRSAAARP